MSSLHGPLSRLWVTITGHSSTTIASERRFDNCAPPKAAQRNALYDLARVAVARGELEQARGLAQQYRQQVEIGKIPFEGWQVHELEGLILAASGDWAGSAGALSQANQQDPGVLFLMARGLAEAGDAEGAHSDCRRVVEFNQLNVNYGFVRRAALTMCGG